jgi:hypothetical protein
MRRAVNIITQAEHQGMAVALATIEVGHRRVNVISTARKSAALRMIVTAGQWLSKLNLALEMTIPIRTPSPYFKEYVVDPPTTNDGLIELLKERVGTVIVGRAPAKIVKTYQQCERAFCRLAGFVPPPDLDPHGIDPWGDPRPKW